MDQEQPGIPPSTPASPLVAPTPHEPGTEQVPVFQLTPEGQTPLPSSIEPTSQPQAPAAPVVDGVLDDDLAAVSAEMNNQEETNPGADIPVEIRQQATNVIETPTVTPISASETDPPAPQATPTVPSKSKKKPILLIALTSLLLLGLGTGYGLYFRHTARVKNATTTVPVQKLATGTVNSITVQYPKIWVVTDSTSWDFYAQDMSNQDKYNLSYAGFAILPYSSSSGYKSYADAKASTAKNYLDVKSATYKPTEILKKDRTFSGKAGYYVEYKAPGVKSSGTPNPDNLHVKMVLLDYDPTYAVLIEMQVTDTQAVEINEFENIINSLTIKK